MEEMKRKLKRALNLMWSIPLLVILLGVGALLSVTVERRLVRPDVTPGDGENGKKA